jgi:DnaJ-class molecular chaperone
MVKVEKLMHKFGNLDEHNEVKDIVARQLAEHLKGGYIEELLQTLKLPHQKPEVLKEIKVGKSLVGSAMKNKVKCSECKGKGTKYNKVCKNCEGAGWLDWLDKGFNFVSSLFGKKKDLVEPPYEENFDQDYYEAPKPKAPAPKADPDFLVSGPRKAQLLSILGLGPSATKADVSKAYKKLALKHHPDKGGDPSMFRQINDAKTELIGGELKQKKSSIGTKNEVWNGGALRTSGGLKKSDLMKNSKGKIISKKQFEAGKRAYENIKAYSYPKKHHS